MSTFVFLFLLVFRPFGLATESSIVSIAAGFGGTCLVTMLFLNSIVIRLLPGFFDENNWFVWKEIVWEFINVSSVGFANALFASWMFELPFNGKLILVFEGFTIAVAFLPMSFFTLFNYVVKRQQYERVSEQLTPLVKTNRHLEEHNPTAIVFEKAGEEPLTIDPEALVYIQAADNYLELYSLEGSSLRRDVIRKTLKSACDDLEFYPNIIQVHRSFIANLDQVERISGNAQGLKLHFEQTDAVVPVSRKLTTQLQQYFAIRP